MFTSGIYLFKIASTKLNSLEHIHGFKHTGDVDVTDMMIGEFTGLNFFRKVITVIFFTFFVAIAAS